MGKIVKRVLTFISISALGFLAYKIYKFFKDVIELEKMLPQYLKTQYGELPELNLVINLGAATLTAKFSKETLQKKEQIKKDILEYIENYYSCLSKHKFKIVLEQKENSIDGKEQQLKARIQRAEEKIESLKNDSPKPKKQTTAKKQTKTNNKKNIKKTTEKKVVKKQTPTKKTTRKKAPKKTTKKAE